MKVSILIPTLNRRSFLAESLDSARRQSHAELEILVSDNGSTDGTPALVERLQQEDPRVRLLPRNPNPGLFQNVNHLVHHARGDCFGILSDDDRLLPDYVQALVQMLRAQPSAGVAFCDHWIIDRAGTRQEQATLENSRHFGRHGLPEGLLASPLVKVMRGVMSVNFSLYRTRFFQDARFDLACGGAADLDFAIRAAVRAGISYVPERLGEYRVHGANTTSREPAYMINGIIHVLEKHRFDDAVPEAERRLLLRQQYLIKAYYEVGHDPQQGRAALERYLILGGTGWHVKAMAARLLHLLPTALARQLKHILSFLKRGQSTA